MSPKILVVDDEHFIRFGVSQTLGKRGFAITCVETASEALQELHRATLCDEPYQLLMSDICMPGMSGEELLDAIRRDGMDIPFLAMSAHGDKEMVVRLMQQQCIDFLDKPFGPDELIARVERIMSRCHHLQTQQSRLEELGRMEMNTRQLIHDLNNVIGATIGYGSIAMEQLADYDPVKHYIEGMTTSALQAAELCKHYLLNYKKGEQMERCTINAIVTQTAAILESIKPATVNIVMDLTVDELIGSIKPLRLQQALLNLGFNAIQAMPQGGTLTYSSQLQRDDQGGRALIRVSDTGSGIAEAIRERIFTLGFTTKPEGNGIGLHIIKKVVEEHHGTLALVSTKMGGGSCFEITLPLLKV